MHFLDKKIAKSYVLIKKYIVLRTILRNMSDKYIYDSERLEYVVEKRTFAFHCKRCRKFVFAALAVGVVCWALSYINMIPSAEALQLKKIGDKYIADIKNLDNKFTQIEDFLSEIQFHDDSCYRVLAKMTPLSSDKRMASFGGVNRYEMLEGYFNTDLLVDYNRKVDILAKKLNLQMQSYEAVVRSAKRCDDSLLSIPAILPVAPKAYRVSSPFGWREHPITHRQVHHDGLDMAAVEGSRVYSSGNGVVVSTSSDAGGYGKQVVVDHGFGYKTRYAHLSKFSVHVGDTVSRGTEIGRVGNTGLSTGPHLHYEVITPKGRQNPVNYFVKDLSQAEYKEMINSFAAFE